MPPPPPPAAPRHPQQHAQHQQQPYWPQPEPQPSSGYVPPPLPKGQPQGHDQQGYYFPPQGGQPSAYDAYGQSQHQPHAGTTNPSSLSSYVPALQNAPWQQPEPPSLNDPLSYDLGHYAAGQPAGQPYGSQGHQGHDRLPPDFGQYGAAPGHAPQNTYYPQPAQQGFAPQHQGYDQGYADPYAQPAAQPNQQIPPQMRAPAGHHGGPPALPHGGYDPYGQPLAHDGLDHGDADEDFDEEEYEDEPPRRGKRSLMVVAALVGAIGIGGGLAYGYKKFVGPTAGKQQIAKAETVKTPPPERKIAERLPDVVPQASSEATPGSDSQDLGGPRKVQLIPITPSGVPGSVVASAPPPAVPQRAAPIAVPGVMLENTAPPPPVRVPVAAAPPPLPAAVAPVQPVRPAPVARPAPAVPAVEAPAEEAPKKVARLPATKGKANDAYAPGGTPTASVPPAAKAGGNGYVAVLASQKSRMDALKVYADLQQKYGDVLSNKPADVQEANLGDKGIYYRAVVGPPGSREAATTLCTQMKTAGYTGCWVTAY